MQYRTPNQAIIDPNMTQDRTDYRAAARASLARARKELDSNDDARLAYAALELRLALEALAYARLDTFEDLFRSDREMAWQPKQVLQALERMVPGATQPSSLAIGVEEVYGVESPSMRSLGTDDPLDTATVRKHYDALGSFLHMPTRKQLNQGRAPDLGKLRGRCGDLVLRLGQVLSSPIHGLRFNLAVDFPCERCDVKVSLNLPIESHLEVSCVTCGAQYLVKTELKKSTVQAMYRKMRCHRDECERFLTIWNDELVVGKLITCESCGFEHEIGLSLRDKTAT